MFSLKVAVTKSHFKKFTKLSRLGNKGWRKNKIKNKPEENTIELLELCYLKYLKAAL